MGEILSTKSMNGKVVFEIEVDYDEAIELKGRIHNIHLFSEETAEIKSNISIRGKRESTKYFLIPRELRKDVNFDSKVKCQKIETDTKTIFVFVVDKIKI